MISRLDVSSVTPEALLAEATACHQVRAVCRVLFDGMSRRRCDGSWSWRRKSAADACKPDAGTTTAVQHPDVPPTRTGSEAKLPSSSVSHSLCSSSWLPCLTASSNRLSLPLPQSSSSSGHGAASPARKPPALVQLPAPSSPQKKYIKW
eukprot:768726-Hanusia_phi.AAC.8